MRATTPAQDALLTLRSEIKRTVGRHVTTCPACTFSDTWTSVLDLVPACDEGHDLRDLIDAYHDAYRAVSHP